MGTPLYIARGMVILKSEAIVASRSELVERFPAGASDGWAPTRVGFTAIISIMVRNRVGGIDFFIRFFIEKSPYGLEEIEPTGKSIKVKN